MEKIPRMRTVDQCFKEIKTLDPNTCISKRYLYRLAHENTIALFKSGTKYYIDLDCLMQFLNGGAEKEHTNYTS